MCQTFGPAAHLIGSHIEDRDAAVTSRCSEEAAVFWETLVYCCEAHSIGRAVLGIWHCMGWRGLHKSIAVVKNWNLNTLVRAQFQLWSLHDEAQIGSLLFDLPAGVCLL